MSDWIPRIEWNVPICKLQGVEIPGKWDSINIFNRGYTLLSTFAVVHVHGTGYRVSIRGFSASEFEYQLLAS